MGYICPRKWWQGRKCSNMGRSGTSWNVTCQGTPAVEWMGELGLFKTLTLVLGFISLAVYFHRTKGWDSSWTSKLMENTFKLIGVGKVSWIEVLYVILHLWHSCFMIPGSERVSATGKSIQLTRCRSTFCLRTTGEYVYMCMCVCVCVRVCVRIADIRAGNHRRFLKGTCTCTHTSPTQWRSRSGLEKW